MTLPLLADRIDGMPRLIQAGMGVRVSGWRLAREAARLGALGVVSHVGLRHIVIDEVRAGDPEAIAHAQSFPVARYADELLSFAPGGANHRAPVPLDQPDPQRGALPRRLSTIAAYVEVARAKTGHRGPVGINVMWKCALTVLPSVYGALLAGVDALLCGAGVPMELPAILTRLRRGEDLCFDPLHGTETPVQLEVAGEGTAALLGAREAPRLLPILSNFAFPRRLLDVWAREHEGARPWGFLLEHHAAGGHNAPPRNKVAFADADEIDSYAEKVIALGLPVYIAGAFPDGGSAQALASWRARGAYGLQVGSRFALCDESGIRRDLKDALLRGDEGAVRTDLRVSPTGYPFKLAPLPGTLADPNVRARRRRVCNKGYLLHAHRQTLPDGSTRLRYLCPAMPQAQYRKLGGDPADTEGRLCLCNGLLATVGLGAKDEPALVTLGESGAQLRERRTAREVIEEILTPEYVAAAERALALSGG